MMLTSSSRCAPTEIKLFVWNVMDTMQKMLRFRVELALCLGSDSGSRDCILTIKSWM